MRKESEHTQFESIYASALSIRWVTWCYVAHKGWNRSMMMREDGAIEEDIPDDWFAKIRLGW